MNRALLSRRLLRLAVVVGLAVPAASFAHDVPGEHPAIRVAPVSLETVSSEMAAAAVAFWNALTPEQQAKATYTMENDERLNWHFIPKPRNGLPIKEMTPPQRNLAWAFLSTGLSNHGFTKAQQIMSLEQILSLGIHPEWKRVLIVKGVVAPRAAYEPVAARIVLVDSAGVTSDNPRHFDYKHRRVPLFPLEDNAEYGES